MGLEGIEDSGGFNIGAVGRVGWVWTREDQRCIQYSVQEDCLLFSSCSARMQFSVIKCVAATT